MEEDISVTLRSYQKMLVEICCNSNSIVYLPTGAGKTFIALHTVKMMSSALLSRSLDDGGKRAVVLVPTKALVYQTSEVFKVQTSFDIGEYTGDKGVDFWSARRWMAECEKKQVLIMTPAVLQNILMSGYIQLNIFNLIVADECHHGVRDDPFRAVMREMQDVPESERPRIIGLTAALINRTVTPKIKSVLAEIEGLEKTFHGQIVTCDELSEVLRYSTNPILDVVSYDKNKQPLCALFEERIKDCIAGLKELLTTVANTEGKVAKEAAPRGYDPSDKKNAFYKVIGRAVDGLYVHLEEFGIYGAAVAALYYIISFEMDKLMAENALKEWVYSQTVSSFQYCRSALLQIMEDDESAENILKFSSKKIQQLVSKLKYYASAQDNEGSLSAIIFVQRRITATVLNYILQKLSKSEKFGLETVTCAFVCGNDSNPFQMTREQHLVKNYFKTTMNKFRTNEVNLLVATNVIEEGVDVPSCNLVIKFDTVGLDYRSYLQAKGRARSRTSHFVLLVAEGQLAKTLKKIDTINEIHEILRRLLIGRNEKRHAPSSMEIEKHVYGDDVEPYYVAGPGSAHANGVSSISCVFKYCNHLPQDLFSKLEPLVYTRMVNRQFTVVVQLPNVSPVCELIQSDPMPNSRLAKRSAFIKAVKILHAGKELNDDLKPVVIDSSAQEFRHLFPHYTVEPCHSGIIAGTNRSRRFYNIIYPAVMNGGLPTPDKSCFLHVLRFTANLENTESDQICKVGNHFASSSTYAILTTNSFPKICTFPLYTSSYELTCELLPNAVKLTLNKDQLDRIAEFHFELFTSVIPASKRFQLLNRTTERNAYYVVPVLMKFDKSYEIDWNTVSNVKNYMTKVEEDPSSIVLNDDTHNLSVISPFYRLETPRSLYLVTKVLHDMSPLSPFPDSSQKDYLTYFKSKYNKDITNVNQPLFQVKPMPKLSSNFMHQRNVKSKGIAYREILVPELCDRYLYPSSLWLKGFLLPTVLHRVTSLLLADELLNRIAVDTTIAQTKKATWAPLIPDPFALVGESTAKKDDLQFPSFRRDFQLSKAGKQPPPLPLQEKEPQIPFCHMDTISEDDLQFYVEYAMKKRLNPDKVYADEQHFKSPYRGSVSKLKVLELTSNDLSVGPQLRDILAALTAKSAHDIINLERLETLGDSFLKFASSLFLFREFPKMNEGGLASIKSKLVSNRNLLYCAQVKNIVGYMQVQKFIADEVWNPPLFEAHPKIRENILSLKKNPRILWDIPISPVEKFSGVISVDNLEKMQRMVFEAEPASDEAQQQSVIVNLFRKCLSDKSVADCVEALLGAFLQASGTTAGFKILNWFNILPAPNGSQAILIDTMAPSPLLESSTSLEILRQLEKINYQKLEEILGYSFKDKAYLLQALTHPTFLFHKATGCYQRLEFLGDAVIDTLITCYIYEKAPHLGPGEMTALRSALVNNNTFASLTVRYGLHRFILYVCQTLGDAIAAFVSFQEDRGHIVDDAVHILLEEQDCQIAEAVEVPKVLGDIFESLAGAIFLDSGNSLKAVWDVYYRLMKTELDTFPSKIPRNPIQVLHELAPSKILNIETNLWGQGICRTRIELTLPSNSNTTVYGFGLNKLEARRSAAKLAIKLLSA